MPSKGSGSPASSGDGPAGSPRLARSTLWEDDAPDAAPLRAQWDPIGAPVTPREPPRRRAEPAPTRTRPARRRSKVGWFFSRYGWRAYAIPLLVALTVVAVLQVARSSGSAATTAEVGSAPAGPAAATSAATVTVDHTATATATATSTSTSTVVSTSPASGSSAAGSAGPVPSTGAVDLPAGALPAGSDFTVLGKGTWHVVPGTFGPVGHGPIKLTYTVEVEDGVGSAGTDQEFASAVDAVLSDPRSWVGSGQYTFQRISSGTPSFRISLTSQMTERRPDLCSWEIQLEASCYARDLKRVSINDARWIRGAVSFHGDLGSYRVYAINHETGHALGFSHQPCPTDGGLAPVMMQQSWSTADDDLHPLAPDVVPEDHKVCNFNPYPYPEGPVASAASGH